LPISEIDNHYGRIKDGNDRPPPMLTNVPTDHLRTFVTVVDLGS
jgi:hypothetical protein